MMLAIYLVIIAVSIIADQITKYAVVANMTQGQSIPVIQDVLHITYVTNDGAAMGMMDDYRWIFMSVSTVALIAMIVWICFSYKKMSKLSGIAFSMIIGGGIGNMIDRVFNGEVFGDGVVVDFIDFCAFPNLWKWIFNLADSLVCVGVALVVVDMIIEEVVRYKRSREEKISAKAPSEDAVTEKKEED